jgi:hypothetical protein
VGAIEHAESDQDLKRGGEGVEQSDAWLDQMLGQRDRPGYEPWLAGGVRRDDLGNKRPREHERLKLQDAVGEPDQAERGL